MLYLIKATEVVDMKKIICALVTVILLISLVSCAKREVQFEIGTASKIKIFSGSTGQSVEITDSEIIKTITDDINSHTFTKDKSSKNWEGFSYYITWYAPDGEQMEEVIVMTESRISYDDYFYDKEECNCEIDTAYIEALFANQ